MSVLILEALEADVVKWLAERYAVEYAPDLVDEPQALRDALHHVHALILPPSVAVDAAMLRSAPRLRVVGRMSGGVENISMDACRAAHVEVARSLTATASAEAEFVIGALLAMLRRVPVEADDGMLVGRELGCATVGLIGITPAARQLGQLLPAFGTRVLGYDPAMHESDGLWARWGITPVPLRELMEQCDGVAVQLGYFQRYRGLMGDRVLSFAKQGQVIVSTAHSAVFNESALADALNSGRVLAAWFDSLEPGVLEPERPLYGVQGLQVTPRLSGTTRESRLRAAWGVARRIDQVLTTAPEPSTGFRQTFPADLPEDEETPPWR